MSEEFGADELRALARLQSSVADVIGTLRGGLALAPACSVGMDDSGTVRVRLGPDGLPDSFEVTAEWHRRRAVGDFDAAVMAANRAALEARVAAWEANHERAESTPPPGHTPSHPTPPPGHTPSHPTPPPGHTPSDPRATEPATGQPTGPAPSPGALAEAFLRLADDVLRRPRPPAPPRLVEGSDRDGRVRLTVSDGALSACATEPEWLARQSSPTLTRALNDAARDLRSKGPLTLAALGPESWPAATTSDQARVADLAAAVHRALNAIGNIPAANERSHP